MEYLIFTINSRLFAIESSFVEKIYDQSAVTRLPFVNEVVAGLVNIDGDVVPQLDLIALLGDASEESYQQIIVKSNGLMAALKVSNILDRVSVDEVVEEGGLSDAQYISTELKVGDKRVLLIQLEKLLTVIKPKQLVSKEVKVLANAKEFGQSHYEEQIGHLCFLVGEETIALPLLDICEVIEIDRLTKVPGAPSLVKGLANLRGQPLLVLSSRDFFGISHDEVSELMQLVVLDFEGSQIAISVDSIVGVSSFYESEIIRESSSYAFVDAYIVDQNEGIVLIANKNKLFNTDEIDQIRPYIPQVLQAKATKVVEYKKLLRVSLGEEFYAIPIENVRRICDLNDFTSVVNSQKGIIGSIDVDGKILPVVNIQDKLNILGEHQFEKMIVVDVNCVSWAVCISDAHNLINVDVSKIDASEHQKEIISGITNYQGELISLVDFNWLSTQEMRV